jgi:vacuolar-type H+-ATPase subunit D/Vma8
LLDEHAKREEADLSEVAAKVTEVLADLILMASAEEQILLMSRVVSNLGEMVFQKSQQTDQTGPGHPKH